MMKRLILFLALLGVGLQSVLAQIVIMPGDYADPTVLKDGDDYYMTHSPFHYQPGFLIWHSRDLLNWEPVCRAGSEWKGSAWAPDLQKVGDTYYIYFPADNTNWVMTAKDIRGPWTEPKDVKVSGIDPGLLVTPDGKRYLFTAPGQMTPLTDDGLERDGQTQTVYEGWKYPREWQTECMCLESPKLSYHDGYYYMTSAEGGTAGPATSHMAVCARSKSVMGPWENSPYNPIVHTYSADDTWWSKGHGTIVEGPGGQWWIIYHAYQKGAYWMGRQTLMEPIEWTPYGWYRTVNDMPLPKPAAPAGLSDDFGGTALGWQWTGWKEDLTKVACLNKGKLTIPGRGTSPKDGRLMLTTATDTCFSIEADIMVDKKDCQAGLVFFYSEKAFAGVLADAKNLTIYKDATHAETVPNNYGRHLCLRAINRNGSLDILASSDGNDWQVVSAGIDMSDFHHNNYREFLALRPGLCVTGKGKAVVDNFVYQAE